MKLSTQFLAVEVCQTMTLALVVGACLPCTSVLSSARAQTLAFPCASPDGGPPRLLLVVPLSLRDEGAANLLVSLVDPTRGSVSSTVIAASSLPALLAAAVPMTGFTKPSNDDGLPQEARSAYVDTSGMAHEYVTWREPGESNDDWVSRHQAGLAALILLFPIGNVPSDTTCEAETDLVTSWTDIDNIQHTVTTPKAPGDTIESWHETHDETVAAFMKKYPEASHTGHPKPSKHAAAATIGSH